MTDQDNKENKNPQQDKKSQDDASVTGVLGSMIDLVSAGTQFSVEQMQNAAALFTEPRAAMSRVKESMDNLSHAMTGKGGDAAKEWMGEASHATGQQAQGNQQGQSNQQADEHLSGRKA